MRLKAPQAKAPGEEGVCPEDSNVLKKTENLERRQQF